MATALMATLLSELTKAGSEGLSIKEIADRAGPTFARRTIQRRLAELVSNGTIVYRGGGRARRYCYRGDTTVRASSAEPRHQPNLTLTSYVPSAVAQPVLKKIVKPLAERHQAVYRRKFLDSYKPNRTFYLAPSERKMLLEFGSDSSAQLPAGTYIRRIYNRLLIDLTWNSSRLEGNTYSLLETERLLVGGKTAKGRDGHETQMILNHKAAIELLVSEDREVGFNSYTFLNLHALLSDNLLGDPMACGKLRTIPVAIGGSHYQPSAVPAMIAECFRLLLAKAGAIADPFEQALFILVQIPYLQPFEDVNKRVSRLAANIGLIRSNLCPLSFVDVPDTAYVQSILAVYELNNVTLLKELFIWAYQRSCLRYGEVRKAIGEPDPFRLKHREILIASVAQIVRDALPKDGAIRFISELVDKQMAHASFHERQRLIEMLETELMSLHEGNIARFKIRPSEFRRWQEIWGSSA